MNTRDEQGQVNDIGRDQLGATRSIVSSSMRSDHDTSGCAAPQQEATTMITPRHFLSGRSSVQPASLAGDPSALEIRSLLEFAPLRTAMGLDGVDVNSTPAARTPGSPRFNRRRLLEAAAA